MWRSRTYVRLRIDNGREIPIDYQLSYTTTSTTHIIMSILCYYCRFFFFLSFSHSVFSPVRRTRHTSRQLRHSTILQIQTINYFLYLSRTISLPSTTLIMFTEETLLYNSQIPLHSLAHRRINLCKSVDIKIICMSMPLRNHLPVLTLSHSLSISSLCFE